MIEVLRETTEWQTDYRVPNHVYLVKGKNRMVGYVPEGTQKVIRFNKPGFFDQRGRSFTRIMTLDR